MTENCRRCGHSQSLHPQTEAVRGRCMWPVVPDYKHNWCECPAYVPPLRVVDIVFLPEDVPGNPDYDDIYMESLIEMED